MIFCFAWLRVVSVRAQMYVSGSDVGNVHAVGRVRQDNLEIDTEVVEL